MKILKFNINDYDINPSEIEIKHLAFSSVELVSEENLLAHVCFECMDTDGFLIKLNVPILIANDRELVDFSNKYEGIVDPSGLMITCAGASSLCVIDIFRKIKGHNLSSSIFETYCADLFGNKERPECFKVKFRREHMLIIMAFVQDVLALNYVSYKSHYSLYWLTSDVKEISISNSKYNLEVLGLEVINKGNILKSNNELSVLIRLNSKDPNKDDLYTVWNLGFNKEKTKTILSKRKKLKNTFPDKVLDKNGKCIDPLNIADIFIGYTIVNYAINADNPMSIMYIQSLRGNGPELNSNSFVVYTVILSEYNEFLEKIYSQLTEVK